MARNFKTSKPAKDVYQIVTDKIVAALAAGVKPWEKPWESGAPSFPLRANGEPYRGINVFLLWGEAMEAGYTSPYWMTYRQASELGGQVRKGERGSMVVYAGTAPKKDEDGGDVATDENGRKVYRFLRAYTVFNADQIEDLPERYRVKAAAVTRTPGERIEAFEAFTKETGATIRHGGGRAFYRMSDDIVQMPEFEAFPDAEKYYATLAHELTHWTRHPSRLDRDFGRKAFGDEGYAKEELVAELGAAFIGAAFGFKPDHIESHAAYIGSWLQVLKDDKRFIFTAASKAQQAVDFLTGHQPQAEEPMTEAA